MLDLWGEEYLTMNQEDMEIIQLAKLKKQFRYECKTSAYFRERIEGAGVVPEKIKSLDEIRKIPLFTKDDHRKSQEDSLKAYGHPYGMHVCAPMDKIVCVNATSGTTGIPTFYTFTKKDIITNNECTARSLWMTGVRPGDTVILGFALSMFVGGFPLASAVQHLGAKVLPVGAEAGTMRFLEFAQLSKPTHMILTPSFAEYLIQKCPEVLGKEIKELGVKTLYCGGEAGAGEPAVRNRLEEAYGAKIYDSMGGAYGFHSTSCDKNQGLHIVTSDYIHIELVHHETKEPIEIEDGAIGSIVHTSLEWEGGPNLRYDMGDVVQIFTEPCECGIKGLRFKMLGRSDDMLIVKGINVHPTAVKNLVTKFYPRTTGELRVMLHQPGPKVEPPIKLKIEHGGMVEDLKSLKDEIEQNIHDLLRFKAKVELVPEGTLERTSKKTKLVEKCY